MNQIPPDATLLAATIDYLEAQLLPALDGEHRFQTRLAVNALKALQRSQKKVASHVATAGAELQSDIWAQKIRAHEVTLDDSQTLLYIENSLRQTLEINNPKWLNA